MPRSSFRILLIAATVLSMSFNLHAQGRAEGGILIRDNVAAYASSEGERTRDLNLPKGTVIVGITTMLGLASAYQFEESNGRVHATYVLPNNSGEQVSIYRDAWFQKDALERFIYECGCPSTIDSHKCYPYVQAGWTTVKYSVCVREGASKKLAELRASLDKPPATAASNISAPPTEKPLTNEDVLALVRAGLGDALVIAKIQQAPAESLDVSIDTLIQLRKEGLAQTVLDAMLKRASQRK